MTCRGLRDTCRGLGLAPLHRAVVESHTLADPDEPVAAAVAARGSAAVVAHLDTELIGAVMHHRLGGIGMKATIPLQACWCRSAARNCCARHARNESGPAPAPTVQLPPWLVVSA